MTLNDILSALRNTAAQAWQPASGMAVIGVALLLGFILWQHLTSDHWVILLDNANLAIHEAGHPLLGAFSRHLEVYGGTLFQLLFPLIFAAYFWRRRHAAGWAVTLVWFGENLLNVARYMADARAHRLPLVGAGHHDWTEIFGRWGVLTSDTSIAGLTRLIGFCIMLAAVFWLWRRWHKARAPARRSYRR